MPHTHQVRGRAPDAPGRKPTVRRAARNTVARAAAATRGSRSTADIHAVQRAAGNAVAQRLIAAPAAPSPTTDSGGDGAFAVQRLWSPEEFAEQTYEGLLTRRSAAQRTIDALIKEFDLLSGAKKPNGAQQLSLLDQMHRSAEYWIADHTVTLDNETEEDPGRKKRMAGMRAFLTNVDAEINTVKTAMTKRGEDPNAVKLGEEHKKFRKLREKYEGGANSVFARLGGLIDGAVPNVGDSAELDVEVSIPIDPHGAFIGGHLKTGAEHGDEGLIKARTELTVTTGLDAPIAKFKAEAGGYVEAQAPTGKDVMNLYSYGLYRRFRESKIIPRELTNYMWGGRAGSFGKKKSERWSRELETQLFKKVPLPSRSDKKYQGMSKEKADQLFAEDKERAESLREQVENTYVETGGMLGGSIEFSVADLVDVALSGGYTSGRKISAESIEKVKEVGGENKATSGYFGRGAQQKLGESTSAFSLGAEISSGPVSGSVGVTWSGEEREVEIEGGFAMPVNSVMANGVGSAIALFVATAVKVLRYAALEKSKRDAKNTKRGAGADTAEDLTLALTQLTKSSGDTFKPKFESAGPDELGVEATMGLTATIGITSEKEQGTYHVTEGSFELSFAKEKSLTVPKALAVTLETKSRLLRVEHSGDGWAVK